MTATASSPTSTSTAMGSYATDWYSFGLDGRRADRAAQSPCDNGRARGAGATRLGLSFFRRGDAANARHGAFVTLRHQRFDVVRDDGCDDGSGRVPNDTPLRTGSPPFERASVQATNCRFPRRVSRLLARFRLGCRRTANLDRFTNVDGSCRSLSGGGPAGCRRHLPAGAVQGCVPKPLPVSRAIPQSPISPRTNGRFTAGTTAWCLLCRLLLAADGSAIRRRRDEPYLDCWPDIVGRGREAASGRNLARKDCRRCDDRLGRRPSIPLGPAGEK